MFWENYRKDADTLRLSDEATDRVLTALHRETAATQPKHRTPLWRRAVVLAACAALVVTAILILPAEKPRITCYPDNKDSAVTTLPVDEHLTYSEVFQLLDGMETKRGGIIAENGVDLELGSSPTWKTKAAANSLYADPSLGSDGTLYGDSTTNTQYADVDEADVIKAQGGYIYVLNRREHRFTIYRADGKNTAMVATRQPAEDNDWLLNMYLTHDRLVVLYTHHETAYAEDADYPYSYMRSRVHAVIYDITDPTAPRYLTAYGQDGTLVDSRMVGGVLYLITDHTVWSVDEADTASFVPSLYRDGGCVTVNESTLLSVPTPDMANYAVITAVAVTGETARLAERSVLGAGGSMVWANAEHLMLMQCGDRTTTVRTVLEGDVKQNAYEYNDTTDLLLFDITDGAITQIAVATVDGSPDGQFALDEYNGYFRIATTCTRYHNRYEVTTDADGTEQLTYLSSNSQQEQNNRLYVLDSALRAVGQIDDMAPGETVRSVRFDGDIGYVVTFRQTDPLFAIDLSDPTDPTVLSALKITGFSEYLHPFGDTRLLGFGYAGTENGLNGRLKLTMFDTTDKTDVTVKTYLELPSQFAYSDALNDHHAILVDTDRSVVGVPLYANDSLTYMLYRYTEEKGFTPLVRCGVENAEALRGLFIGECFYLVHENGVAVYDGEFTLLTTI